MNDDYNNMIILIVMLFVFMSIIIVINLCLFLLGTFGEVELASFGILFQWASFVFMVRSFVLFLFSLKYMIKPSSPSIWKSFA